MPAEASDASVETIARVRDIKQCVECNSERLLLVHNVRIWMQIDFTIFNLICNFFKTGAAGMHAVRSKQHSNMGSTFTEWEITFAHY